MNENIDAMLKLDTSSVKERTTAASSSLTDINQIPVFSDSFEESVEEKKAREKDRNEMIADQVFGEGVADAVGEDIRSQMFLQTSSTGIVRNDAAASTVPQFLQIPGVFIAAGLLLAGMIWLYGRKGKRKANVDNQHEVYIRETKS